jgi:2-dehydro-3-deoxyglucarate aldolase/4-hydroxy-2-oxoheptanedioate aldolase
MDKIENLRKKIETKRPVIGTHVLLSDSCIAEIMAGTGYDFIWVDLEHTGLDKKDVLLHAIACEGTETAIIVRIPWNDPAVAKPILDMGVDGIIFPNVRTAEEARQAVGACVYPPEGYRGFGPLRAVKYGMAPASDYIQKVRTGLWKIMQIEHIDGVDNLDEILDVPGIDTIVVGPFDLATSMGYIGDPGHPKVKEAMDAIARKTAAKGIPLGVSMLTNPPVVKEWMDRGIQWISLDTDIVHIVRGAKETLKATEEMWRRRN